jgi:hypothetical protein
MQVVIFSSPQRKEMLRSLLAELKGLDVHVIDNPQSFGKEFFWQRWEEARRICINSKHDEYLILPDDVSKLDLHQIRKIHNYFKGRRFVCSVINDGRKDCWGSVQGDTFKLGLYNLTNIGFFDCGGLSNRKTLSQIEVKRTNIMYTNRMTSSGVGMQLTRKLAKMNATMYVTTPALCYHGTHESVMHPEERKRNPLISQPRMKVIIGIATMQGREASLKATLRSLTGQADQIRIYNNAEREVDYTDNGKFYFLKEYNEPIYYLSCDDDLIYPPTYVRDMVDAINRTGTIVTHHGRILRDIGRSYYRGHKVFQCLRDNRTECEIDVAGTGVCGFRTDYFNPTEIYKAEDKRMSDLVFSLEAIKQKKRITVLQHPMGYFGHTDNEVTIHAQYCSNDSRQSEIADEILQLRRLKSN